MASKNFKMKDSKILTKAIKQTETWELYNQIKTKTSKQTNRVLTFRDIFTLCIAWKIICTINTCGSWQTLLIELCNSFSNPFIYLCTFYKAMLFKKILQLKRMRRELYRTLTRPWSLFASWKHGLWPRATNTNHLQQQSGNKLTTKYPQTPLDVFAFKH